MNIITSKLVIELLQTCNLDCKHCLNGEKRNVFISKELVEKIFDEVKIVDELFFTGGEVFLAYEQMKMVLDVASQKNVNIQKCSMLTNGTVYDERIYKLLDERFGNNYSIGISNDDYHDKSIRRVYKDNVDEAFENIAKHYHRKNSTGFKKAETILINTGRAKNLNSIKTEYEAIGYYYDFYKNYMLVGPILFIGADGFVTEGNLEIVERENQCLDNLYNKSLYEMITYGGIRLETNDINVFFSFMNKRESDYQNRTGEHFRFNKNKVVLYNAESNNEVLNQYYRELEEINKTFYEFFMADSFGAGLKKLLEYDFSRYPHDISQVDHSN